MRGENVSFRECKGSNFSKNPLLVGSSHQQAATADDSFTPSRVDANAVFSDKTEFYTALHLWPLGEASWGFPGSRLNVLKRGFKEKNTNLKENNKEVRCRKISFCLKRKGM